MAKVQRDGEKSRVQAREARGSGGRKIKKPSWSVINSLASSKRKQAVLAKEYKAQVKQLIEMNALRSPGQYRL